MGILHYHPILREIIHRLDYSILPQNKRPVGWYSSSQIPYEGDTIFEGHGLDDNLWLSVNIIEGEDDLFVHTTLQIKQGINLVNEVTSFSGFRNYPKTSLIRVAPLNCDVNKLIDEINTRILPNLI